MVRKSLTYTQASAVELLTQFLMLEFSRVKDISGQCDMMAKKATIMHLVGDFELADDYAAKYLDLKEKWKAEIL